MSLDLGPYFTANVSNMIRGVPQSKVGKDRDNYKTAGILIVFVKDLDDMYDSLSASDIQLKDTIFFKVMTILGTLVARRKSVWIEETRSIAVKPVEQKQIIANLGANGNVSPDLLYAYAIEFRGREDKIAEEAFNQL